MKNKLILFAIIILSAVFIAACNTSNTDNTGNDDNESAKSSDNTNETASEEPYAFSISLRTLALPYVDNHSNINEDVYVKKLEELTNTDIDIRLMPHNDFTTNMDLMFASGDIPDVVNAQALYSSSSSNGRSLQQAVDAGVFLPLDDLIDEHGPNLKKYISEEYWEDVRYTDGKIYGIPQILSNAGRRATFIRMDLLEQTGLDVPVTVEDTLEVLRAFKELGVKQPFAARTDLKYADTFFGAYDVQWFWDLDDNGDPIPKYFDSENMKQAIGTYKTLYDEGLMHPEFLTQDSTQFSNVIKAGDAGMWNMNTNTLVGWEREIQQSVPEADVAVIPSPVGPDGSGGYLKSSNVMRTFLINAETESPEKIIQFFDWLVTEEAETFFTFGIEGEDYTVEDGEINYKLPETTADGDKEAYRTSWLWLITDAVYTKGLMELTPEGQELMEAFDNITMKEGRSGLQFDPGLESYLNYPAIQDKGDVYSDFLIGHIAKMITGAESIDDWDKVLEDWMKQGGDEVLAEAKQRYEAGEYNPPRE